MDHLPSSSFALRGFLRSSHALLGLFAIGAGGLFWLSLRADFQFGEYLFSILFAGLLSGVLIRYAFMGPEADRSQPSISVTHHDNRTQAQFVNVERTPEIIAILQAVQNRRPLPLPVATIEGAASDPNAYRPITSEVAKELQQGDSQLLVGPTLNTPSSKPGGDPAAPQT